MLTAIRMREARERESKGLPPPAPPNPERIAFAVHQQEIATINKAHAQELSALRKELEEKGGKGKSSARVKELEAALEAASKERAALVERVKELEEQLDEATKPADDTKKRPRSQG